MTEVLAAAARIVERHDRVTADMRRQYPSMKMPEPADSVLVARALLSTSSAVRGMREALEKEEKAHGETISERDSLEAFIAELYHDATGSECIWSNNFGLLEVRDAIIAALSLIEGEDEQARPSGSASISTDTKGTTK